MSPESVIIAALDSKERRTNLSLPGAYVITEIVISNVKSFVINN